MRKNKHLKRRMTITMFILSGICLTCVSMIMAVGSDRL